MKKTIAKLSTFSAAALLGIFILNGPANAATTECGSGYIKAVTVNYWAFDAVGSNLIGIAVLQNDNQLHYYYTGGWGNAEFSAAARSLLQLAQSAYLSQAHVFVQVDGTGCTTQTLGGKNWVEKWKGLWLQDQ